MTINNQSLPAQGLDIRVEVLTNFCRREITHAGVLLRGRGWGYPPSHYERGPRLLSIENRRKIEPKETFLLYLPSNLKS